MSFNPNNNNLPPISLNNYEEYFLLYADNELSTEEYCVLEKFLLAHPDLHQELDLLLSTKLPIEQIPLENKEALLANAMKLNAIDEALLLYIDNELSETEKTNIEKRLVTDSAYQQQYKELLQTKPVTPDKIIYPFKKELYRFEEKKRFSLYWMRIAAAVIILLGIGIFVFTYEQKTSVPVAAGKEEEPVNPGTEKRDVAFEPGNNKPVTPMVIKIGETDDATKMVRNLKKKKQPGPIKRNNIGPQVEKEQLLVKSNDEKKQEQKNNIISQKHDDVAIQQTINNPVVTPPAVASYNNQTTPAVTAEQRDVVKTGNEKKASLKGFLRKATRFIERRTNISTTNENNELLIGAVALKL